MLAILSLARLNSGVTVSGGLLPWTCGPSSAAPLPHAELRVAPRAHPTRELSRDHRGQTSHSRDFSELIGLRIQNVIFIKSFPSGLPNRHAVKQKIGRFLLWEGKLNA